MEENEILFEIPVELELRKSADGGRRIVRGYASTENIDQDGEVILQKGIDFSPLIKSGFLNYDHQYRQINGAKVPIIVGYPTKAEIRDKGLWVEGELLKGDVTSTSEQIKLADELWDMGMALQKSGTRSLAYSVEGGVIERRGNKIVKSVVRHLAITHKPVNPDATIELFAKSFCCGKCNKDHPLYVPGHTCASHAPVSKEDKENENEIQKSLGTDAGTPTANGTSPIMRENLDRGVSGIIYGECKNNCWDTSGRFHNGIPGAVEHLQKCRGYSKDQSIALLRKAIHEAPNRPDLTAIIRQAGFGR